jgi:hypothetical protein
MFSAINNTVHNNNNNNNNNSDDNNNNNTIDLETPKRRSTQQYSVNKASVKEKTSRRKRGWCLFTALKTVPIIIILERQTIRSRGFHEHTLHTTRYRIRFTK